MMRSSTKVSFALALVAGSFMAFATGCGGDDSGGSSGGTTATGGTGGSIVGGTGGVGGVGGVGGSGGTTGGTGGSGGTAGDGNDTKETASDIKIGTDPAKDAVQGKLDPVASDIDYYKFDGTANQVISVLTVAKPDTDPFDPTYPDLVVTLYDSTGKQIAEQDDPSPRSSNDPYLITVLPATGTYYLRVVECTKWEKGGSANCADASKITQKNYSLYISEMKFDKESELKEVEPNNDAATSQTLTYTKNPNNAGHYYLTTLYATFADATDVDVYNFTVPSDLAIDAGTRAIASFYPQPAFADGNGATTQPAEVYIAEAATPTAKIAQVDVSAGGSLDVPVTIGTKYVIFYKRSPSTGARDYYFDLSGFGSGNPVEKETTNENDTVAGAEALTPSTGSTGSYFIEGNLKAGTDVDHFSVAVPATLSDQLSVACGALRSGSGLQGFTATLLKGDGSAVTGGSAVEKATEDLVVKDIATPAGETKLIVKLSASSVDPNVSSDYYRCGIHFRPKTN